MTILPNKPKKNVPKGDRHNAMQAGGRTPLMGTYSHSHSHSHHHCISSDSESRKTSSNSSISANGVSTKCVNSNTNNQLSRGDVLSKGDVKGGAECSKMLNVHRKDDSAHNSDDEYDTGFKDDNLEAIFKDRLRRVRGFHIKEVRGDGACLFRAVADQVYGDEEMHSDVRRLCLDYMEKNRDHFSQFVTEDFGEYLARKRREDEHGNHIELQAISEIFSRPIEIYEYCTDPKNIFSPRCDTSNNAQPNPPIRLSYHGAVHYNSVIDPLSATIGVGLGLPGYSPGSADRSLMRDALIRSEVQEIEEAMLKDKMNMTDYERTEQEISEQVARESYMEYVRTMESKRQCSKGGIGVGSKRPQTAASFDTNQPCCSRSPAPKIKSRESSQETKSAIEADSNKIHAAKSNNLSFYEELLACGDWSAGSETDAEDALLAQVMKLSKQEFIESLKEKHNSTHRNDIDNNDGHRDGSGDKTDNNDEDCCASCSKS